MLLARSWAGIDDSRIVGLFSGWISCTDALGVLGFVHARTRRLASDGV